MLIKILHMSFGLLAPLLFWARVAMSWKTNGEMTGGTAKFFKIAPHIVYTVLVLCGLHLLMQLPGVYPHWLIAKLVLFAVAISASIKAFRSDATQSKFRSGVLVASIAYIGIFWLIIAKPGGLYIQQPTTPPAVSSTATQP
jgi:uncharacterized membrane protein SirB2